MRASDTTGTGSAYAHSQLGDLSRNTYSGPSAPSYLYGDAIQSRPTESVAGGRATEMKLIMAYEPEEGALDERPRDYRGRYRRWPGIVLFLAIFGVAIAVIALEAVKTKNSATTNQAQYELASQNSRKIQDGLNSSDDIISDDGQVGNPKVYPDMGCELPNYLSKNGQIIAQAANGTEVAVAIKGVNWFGMETGVRIPLGLWENSDNGTSAYEIAAFLARNKFNSVRLPVCIKSILDNVAPSSDLINLNTNRALNISTYMSTIQTIVKALAYRHISVLISLHTLDTTDSGGAWYSTTLNVTQDQFLEAVDTLTSNLCTTDYWNILGLDLKNEPHSCSWGGDAPDWVVGATLIGNRMLKGCKNWMAFVEGVNGDHTFTLNGTKSSYFDWWGSGLQGVATLPITLSTEQKVVYAPHYYNTGVNPASYLYGGGTVGTESVLLNYVELDNATLKYNVEATFDDMFGYISKNKSEAVILGEFAGLYATDKHPKLTTKRTTDFTIQAMLDSGLAGGYMWSLNPESAYQYNPADTYGTFTEGLLEDDWLTPNKVFLEGMAQMNALPDLKMFPCFGEEATT